MSISCIASHLDTPSYNTAQSDKVENATLITNYQPAAGSYFTKSVLNGKYAFQPDASGIVSSWASTTSVMMSSNTAQTPGSQTSSDKLILVKLPGGMHTYISTKPNQLLCDALERKLFQRDWRVSRATFLLLILYLFLNSEKFRSKCALCTDLKMVLSISWIGRLISFC